MMAAFSVAWGILGLLSQHESFAFTGFCAVMCGMFLAAAIQEAEDERTK